MYYEVNIFYYKWNILEVDKTRSVLKFSTVRLMVVSMTRNNGQRFVTQYEYLFSFEQLK